MIYIRLLTGVYIAIGFLHSIAFSFLISRNDCINATGLVNVFCNTGVGISHAAIVLLWPWYWLASDVEVNI